MDWSDRVNQHRYTCASRATCPTQSPKAGRPHILRRTSYKHHIASPYSYRLSSELGMNRPRTPVTSPTKTADRPHYTEPRSCAARTQPAWDRFALSLTDDSLDRQRSRGSEGNDGRSGSPTVRRQRRSREPSFDARGPLPIRDPRSLAKRRVEGSASHVTGARARPLARAWGTGSGGRGKPLADGVSVGRWRVSGGTAEGGQGPVRVGCRRW